jgi:FAD/FMN-containing dehydrogenase
VQAVLRACHALAVPVVARGAGTGLSGGAMPHALGVTLSLAKFNRILKLDKYSRTAVVQCGVRNLAISEAAAPLGLYYAPDPSSQIACTIGGNVAENSGGVHCLKYGLTLHNVLKVRASPSKASRWSLAATRWTRRGWTCCRGCGQRGHAGHHHRGDRQAGAQAAACALHHGQL